MKTYPLNRSNLYRSFSTALALTTAVLALTPALTHAAAFTSGNVVLVRVGDGSVDLVNTGNPVFLDEYTTAGTFVQSVSLPTAAAGAQFPLILGGTGLSEGLLTRSTDAKYLLLTGYGTASSGVSLSTTTSATVPRVIARVDAAGNIDTSTALTNAMSGGSPRSVASQDGTTFWIAGQGSAAATGGIRYVPVLGTNFATAVETAAINVRQVNIFGGQLYVSSGATAGFRGVNTVGTGVPITSGQSVTLLPGFTDSITSGSPYAYTFVDLDAGVAGVDTLYLTDDGQGITKFSLVAGSWVSNGTVGVNTNDYRGVTATVNGSTVTLYATRLGGSLAPGGGELVSIVDSSGYNGAFASTPTLLATAAVNTAFRGVALAPVATGPVLAPITITRVQIIGANVVIDFTADATETIASFTLLSTTNVATSFTPAASVITTSGPGVFRSTSPVGPPSAFYRIKR